MSALPNDLSLVEPKGESKGETQSDPKPFHDYCAEAYTLTADLEQPLKENIRPQVAVKLPRDGQYQFRQADPFHFEGILSYKSGYTQVAGHPGSKKAGFETLSTSVVEGLNILDVITADRVVAQLSTWHPAYGKGQVPSVTFLGTRFDNLRIAGHEVRITPNLEILGSRQEDGLSYFDDNKVRDRISEQYGEISKEGLPDWAGKEYPKTRPVVQDIGQGRTQMQCSLVGIKESPGFPFGHVIDLPHFGKIFLGELKVVRTPGKPTPGINETYRFHLTMIRLQMGCLATGGVDVGVADSNGTGGKGDGH
jgi:hypothetical protein